MSRTGRSCVSRAAVSTGIRILAQERATTELGPRTVDQVREAYQREAQAAGVTGLDRVLDRVQVAGRIDLATAPTTDTVRPHLAGRLQHLERMGLAKRRGARVFTVEPDFMNVLRQSQERERIGTEIRRVAGAEAAVTRRCCGAPPEEPVVGEVVATGLTRGGQHGFVLLREKVGLIYAEVAPHQAPAVRVGGRVELGDGGRHPADAGLALRLDGDRVGKENAEETDAGREAERRRLAFLVRRGLAVEEEGNHRLDPAVAERLRAGGGAEAPRVAARVLLADAPERYVESPAWTPLDWMLSNRDAPAWPGAEAWTHRRGEQLAARGMAAADPAGVGGSLPGRCGRCARRSWRRPPPKRHRSTGSCPRGSAARNRWRRRCSPGWTSTRGGASCSGTPAASRWRHTRGAPASKPATAWWRSRRGGA